MPRRPRLLIIKAGTAAPVITQKHGDYDQWFIEALGAPERFSVVEAYKGEPLPDARGFEGVIVTGSPLSVCEPTPWMETAASKLREWTERGDAVLGVCFGHQLLSHGYGTPVIKNPKGREIGTVEIALTPEGQTDALLEGLASSFRTQTTHSDIAGALPKGATLLATNGTAAVQAAAFGKRGRGVQFHPEIAPETMRTLVGSRLEILAKEGLDGEAIRSNVSESPSGIEILRRFEERFAG